MRECPTDVYKRQVQSFGKLPAAQASVIARCADTAAFSAHKIGGIKGAAALFVRKGLTVVPLLYGGGQERGLRPGTESLPAIASFGAACADIDRPESASALSAAYAAVCTALEGKACLLYTSMHDAGVALLVEDVALGDLAVAEARDRPRIACAFDVRAVDRAEVLAELGEHPHA